MLMTGTPQLGPASVGGAPLAPPQPPSGIITGCAVWSPDGTKAVFWDNVCTDGTHSCSISKNNLRTDIYVADAATGTATSVIGAKGFFSGDVAISPDGQRLAYTSLTDLYVIDLP
jgi:Tol biopolymer transport system component